MNTLTPTRSWAVAAGTDNPQPRDTRRQNDKDKNCVRISTQRSVTEALGAENNGDAFGRYLPTPAANAYIRAALLKTPSTRDAQVAGIGTTKTGYVVRFKNQASAETVRNNTDWLTELGNDTRLVKPRFGVAVQLIPTFGLDLEKKENRSHWKDRKRERPHRPRLSNRGHCLAEEKRQRIGNVRLNEHLL